MNLRDYIWEYIKALQNEPEFFDISDEKKNEAKRKLPLKKLMRLLGDEEYITEKLITSPFHENGKFIIFRDRTGRCVFSCCAKCGFRGDSIDYLKARFKISTRYAIALLRKLAGIR